MRRMSGDMTRVNASCAGATRRHGGNGEAPAQLCQSWTAGLVTSIASSRVSISVAAVGQPHAVDYTGGERLDGGIER